MKLTFVLPCLPWAPIGGFRTVYEYANYLVANGYDVVAVHPRELPGDTRPIRPPPRGLRARARGLATWAKNRYGRPDVWWQRIDPRVELRYVRRLSADAVPDADAVVATAWDTAATVAGLAPAKGRKLYLVQDFYPYLGPREALEASWRLPLVKVSISSWLAELVAAAGSEAVPNPIAVDHTSLELRRPLEDRGDSIALMCSPAPYKALDVAFEALRLVKARRPDVRGAAFGVMRRPADLPEWVDYTRGIAPDALTALFNDTSVFLCSSHAEGFALPPAEALACGCAVATTDCGGNREYAEHGVTALVSQPGDAQALAEHTIALLTDRELRVRLARAGRQRVRGLTWEASARRFEEVVRRTVG